MNEGEVGEGDDDDVVAVVARAPEPDAEVVAQGYSGAFSLVVVLGSRSSNSEKGGLWLSLSSRSPSTEDVVEKYAEVGVSNGKGTDGELELRIAVVASVGRGGEDEVAGGDPERLPGPGIEGMLNNKLPCPTEDPNGLGLRLLKLPADRGLAHPLLLPSRLPPERSATGDSTIRLSPPPGPACI